MDQPTRLLFVTGRLAERALRHVLDELGRQANFVSEVAVMPISVAALMPTAWVARHLRVPAGVDRVILPGHCRGDLAPLIELTGGRPVQLGPEDLRDLPAFFGHVAHRPADYGAFDIEIIAEINHAASVPLPELLDMAARYRADGADVIDVGCDPGGPWLGVADTVKALRDAGHRVSIDSFDAAEVSAAVSAGAELVLSVNSSNREHAQDLGVEVVAVPDDPATLGGLDETLGFLSKHDVPYRIDPVVEPIGFGFAESLVRFHEVRRRFSDQRMLMGVGNLTELTDVDSAGINVILLGFCQELGITSVLTTQVINWARSSIRELDLARRLVYHSVRRRVLPKHLEPRLVQLRDAKVPRFGPDALRQMAALVKDPNWRIYAEDDRIYAFNNEKFIIESDPAQVFVQMGVEDPPHAFYLGYELAKAKTALTLGKAYRQDQALDWGLLTEPETSHRGPEPK